MAETQEQESKAKSLPSFPKFQLNFPFLNRKPKPEASVGDSKVETAITNGSDGDAEKPGVARVSFPYSRPQLLGTLEAEAEAEVSSGRTSNPVVLWQVYALGGFLIVRWAWARWRERKERRKKNETQLDDQLPPADEDYQTASADADDDFHECR